MKDKLLNSYYWLWDLAWGIQYWLLLKLDYAIAWSRYYALKTTTFFFHLRHPVQWWRFVKVMWIWEGYDSGREDGYKEGLKVGREQGYMARNGVPVSHYEHHDEIAHSEITEGDEQYRYTDVGGL